MLHIKQFVSFFFIIFIATDTYTMHVGTTDVHANKRDIPALGTEKNSPRTDELHKEKLRKNQSRLETAIHYSDEKRINELLAEGTPVTGKMLVIAQRSIPHYFSLLLKQNTFEASDQAYALVLYRNLENLRLMLENGFDINATTRGGEAALMSAARCGEDDCLKFLLEHGAHTDLRDNYGRGAFTHAAMRGGINCMNILLDTTPPTEIQWALNSVIGMRRTEHIQFLLENGADINGKAGTTYHLVKGKKDKLLTPLMWAIKRYSKEIIELLLDRGANPLIKRDDGKKASDIARKHGHNEAEGLLLKAEEAWKVREIDKQCDILNEDPRT